MDVALIDVTGIDCKEGDSVEIFGNNLPVTVLSDALGLYTLRGAYKHQQQGEEGVFPRLTTPRQTQ